LSLHRERLGDRQEVDSKRGETAQKEVTPLTDDVRVLVVDDEPGITDLISMALRYEGLTIEVANSGRQALRTVDSFRPHLMILDIMLPDIDGFEVLRRISANNSHRVPVIFLTARGELEDKLRGFTLGGDDYITKPFSLEELIVRSRAILRRVNEMHPESNSLTFADLTLDEEQHEVTRDGAIVELTPTEFKLLHYLLLNADRVVSKAQILDRVWQYDFDGNDNVVEIFISSLRRKLEESGPRLIHTIRGVGYRLRQPTG
jgi:two-component system OmpR family response regulator